MRYEHIVLDMSTAAVAALYEAIQSRLTSNLTGPASVREELLNLANECRARLQRRDIDPQAEAR